jgi:hypothetical protein
VQRLVRSAGNRLSVAACHLFSLCSNHAMNDHPASWRMPTPKQMEKPASGQLRTSRAMILLRYAPVGDSARIAQGRMRSMLPLCRDTAPRCGQALWAACGLEGRWSAVARRRLQGPDRTPRGGRLLAKLVTSYVAVTLASSDDAKTWYNLRYAPLAV